MIRRVIKVAAKTVGLVALILVLYFGVTFVQIWMRGHEHTTRSAQAILVFGTTEDNGVPSPELTARLDQALHLYKMGRAPWVVVTGGRRPGDVYTEAGVSATYLEDHGVSTSHMLQGAGRTPGRTWRRCSVRSSATTSPR